MDAGPKPWGWAILLHLVYPHNILHNHGFEFLLGITVVPRDIENNGYIKFWGLNRVNYGLCEIVNCIVYCSVMLNYGK